MKKIFLLLLTSLLSFNLAGQTQRNGFSYQALITTPLNNNDVGINLPGVDKEVISYRNKDICLKFTFFRFSLNIHATIIKTKIPKIACGINIFSTVTSSITMIIDFKKVYALESCDLID